MKKTNKKQGQAASHQAGDVLQLMIEQINAAVNDNNSSMAKLIDCHSAIATRADSLTQTENPDMSALEDLKNSLHQELRRMIVAFQSHDEYNQRLQHVTEALAEAKRLVEDPATASDPAQWQALVAEIATKYSTVQELNVHNQRTGKPAKPPTPADDIELF